MEEVSLLGSCSSVVTRNLNGFPNVLCALCHCVPTSSTLFDSEAALESVTSPGQKNPHLYSEHTARVLAH